jgi:hypothetical protein
LVIANHHESQPTTLQKKIQPLLHDLIQINGA